MWFEQATTDGPSKKQKKTNNSIQGSTKRSSTTTTATNALSKQGNLKNAPLYSQGSTNNNALTRQAAINNDTNNTALALAPLLLYENKNDWSFEVLFYTDTLGLQLKLKESGANNNTKYVYRILKKMNDTVAMSDEIVSVGGIDVAQDTLLHTTLFDITIHSTHFDNI